MKLKLNSKQLDRLSEIIANAGILLLASLVIPSFTGTTLSSTMIAVGFVSATLCFIISLYLVRKK